MEKTVAVLFLAISLYLASCSKTQELEELEITNRRAYIAKQKVQFDTLDSIFYYITPGNADTDSVQIADSVSIFYNLYYIKSSGAIVLVTEKQNTDIVYGQTPTIKGWDIILPYLHRNDTGQVVFPSEYAYGNDYFGTIPPYSSVVYFYKITKLIKPNQTPEDK